MKTVAFHTLGCKANQYDTRVMMEQFQTAGWQVTSFEEKPRVVIINSCTVTGKAARHSRQIARREKRANPQALIALVGCYPQAYPEVQAEAVGLDLVLGTDERWDIVRRVSEQLGMEIQGEEDTCPSEQWLLQSYPGRTRAFVKVQDGCEAFCSYCIVPYARGTLRSKPVPLVVREVEQLKEKGFKEVVLTGIHMGVYGKDLEQEIKLSQLIESVLEVGIKRLRLSSLEAMEVDQKLMDLMAQSPSFCPHLHLPLQSGSNRILQAMNRTYTREDFLAKVELVRKAVPHIAFTTDVMVGFPGETEEDFQATVDMIKTVGFAQLHVFPFSRRRGTRAADMKGQIPGDIKKQRSAVLRTLGQELMKAHHHNHIHRTLEVLLEGQEEDGVLGGTTPQYLRVYCAARDTIEPGDLITVKGRSLFRDGLWGEEV